MKLFCYLTCSYIQWLYSNLEFCSRIIVVGFVTNSRNWSRMLWSSIKFFGIYKHIYTYMIFCTQKFVAEQPFNLYICHSSTSIFIILDLSHWYFISFYYLFFLYLLTTHRYTYIHLYPCIDIFFYICFEIKLYYCKLSNWWVSNYLLCY